MLQDRATRGQFKLINNKKPKNKFDEITGLPIFKNTICDAPDQLLIYEVNGKLVHENPNIQPEEIESFKAFNQTNREDIDRERLSYFSGTREGALNSLVLNTVA